MLVRLIRIQQAGIGVTICGGKFGKTGLHACSSPVLMENACGIKAHVIKAQAFFEDALYIRTPSKTSQCTVYMTPCLPISAVDSSIIVQLLSAARSVEVWTSLLPRLSCLPAVEISALLS